MKHIRFMGRIVAVMLCICISVALVSACAAKTVYVYTTPTQKYSVDAFAFYANYIRDVYYDNATYNGYKFDEYLDKVISSDGMYTYEYILNSVKDSYIQYLLVNQKFEEFGLSTNADEQAELDKLFNSLKESFGQEKITSICNKLNITEEQFKDYTVGNSSRAADISDYLFGENGEYAITDEYMLDYYKEEYRRFKYIIVRAEDTEPDSDVAARAQAAYDKAVAGEDFDNLIMQYSDAYVEITDDMSDEEKQNYTSQNDLMFSQGLITDSKGIYDSDYYKNYGSVVDDEILKQVFSMDVGALAYIKLDDSYWVLQLCDNNSSEDFYKSKQADVFDAISTPTLDKLFTQWETDMNGTWVEDVVNEYDPRKLSGLFVDSDSSSKETENKSFLSELSEEAILIIVIGMLLIIAVLIVGICVVAAINSKKKPKKDDEKKNDDIIPVASQSLFGDEKADDDIVTPSANQALIGDEKTDDLDEGNKDE